MPRGPKGRARRTLEPRDFCPFGNCSLLSSSVQASPVSHLRSSSNCRKEVKIRSSNREKARMPACPPGRGPYTRYELLPRGRQMIARTLLLLLVFVFATSCKQSPPEAPKQPPAAEEAKPDKAPEAGKDASTASASGKSDPACIGPIGPGATATLPVGEKTLVREAHALRLQGDAHEQAEIKIGDLANLDVANGENLFSLKRYLAAFEKEGVELILVAGDSGDVADAIERNLDAVAAAGLPTLAIAGNRERTQDF